MDMTKRPFRIPPGFSFYAEKNNLFELYKVKYFSMSYFCQCVKRSSTKTTEWFQKLNKIRKLNGKNTKNLFNMKKT